MTQEDKVKQERKKGFLGRVMEKLDQKMEQKAKKSSCCGGSNKDKGPSCC